MQDYSLLNKSKIRNPKSRWGRSSTESEQFTTNEQVGGSSPLALSNLFHKSFRGRPTGRTLDFESRNKGSNPFPEAKTFYFWAFRRWLYGLDLESSVRRFKSRRSLQDSQRRVVSIGKTPVSKTEVLRSNRSVPANFQHRAKSKKSLPHLSPFFLCGRLA